MTGKQKCRLLKQIRKEIAESNGIVYLTSECDYKEDCKGTCPKCDAEIMYLDTELNKKACSGQKITLAGLALDNLKSSEESALGTIAHPIAGSGAVKGVTKREISATKGKNECGSNSDCPIFIEQLKLSATSCGCLKRHGVTKVEDLCKMRKREVANIDGLSRIQFHEILNALKSKGLSLRPYQIKRPAEVMAMIYGQAIGDALGVPVEFSSRESLREKPVADYREGGTHGMPKGTWSDDTGMALATFHSINEAHGIDYADIMKHFCQWRDEAKYTATNIVFDIGCATNEAIDRFKKGVAPLECGGTKESDNGNGSLMRILPAAAYCKYLIPNSSTEEKIEILHNVSALTHAHMRSKIACGIYYFVLSGILDYGDKSGIFEGLWQAKQYYGRPEYLNELKYYARIFSVRFKELQEKEIKSSGYVVDTLEAALWCLLTTENFKDCVLKAVNLGEDTDTTGAVAGGLAGALYGWDGIPEELVSGVNHNYLHGFSHCFCKSIHGV